MAATASMKHWCLQALFFLWGMLVFVNVLDSSNVLWGVERTFGSDSSFFSTYWNREVFLFLPINCRKSVFWQWCCENFNSMLKECMFQVMVSVSHVQTWIGSFSAINLTLYRELFKVKLGWLNKNAHTHAPPPHTHIYRQLYSNEI